MGEVFNLIKKRLKMIKQEVLTNEAIFNLIEYFISKKFLNIFINFSYVEDDDKPSIIIGGSGSFIKEEDFKNIFLHPDINKRESMDNFIFINSCFNLGKKITITGRKGHDLFSVGYENISSLNPYLDYKKIASKPDTLKIDKEDFVVIKFNSLEKIRLSNDIIDKNIRKPHITFFNLIRDITRNTSVKYYKFLKGNLNFFVSSKGNTMFLENPLEDPLMSNSPFQEEDPQCQELETKEKSFQGLNIKIKSFLISHQNNPDLELNSKNHGIFFMHQDKIVLFDQWELCSIKKKRIVAKDPYKIIRIRVILEGDINYNDIFSINPINKIINISNHLIRIIENQIEIALNRSFSILQNINEEKDIELKNIAKSDALAAYKELVYIQKYDKEEAIKKISKNGEMLKFSFIENYLRGKDI